MPIVPAPAASPPQRGGAASNKIQVVVCDDSAVVRSMICRILEAEPDFAVIGTAIHGEALLERVKRTPPDVVVLDIEMPVMDGITTLPKLLAIDRGLKVIMASTLTKRNAQVSLQALSAGAADYVPKPSATSELGTAGDFQRELVAKVRALGQRRAAARAPDPRGPVVPAAVPVRIGPRAFALRRSSTRRPEVLAIGSSTGGPQALVAMLGAIGPSFALPILVTQHMPATFTAILADHLARAARRDAHEGADGEVVRGGVIYVAPGGHHMVIEKRGAERVIRLTQDPPENFCRPAVDPMFRSVAQVYQAGALGVVLTGMGADGAKGGRAIAEAGGTIIAQDEATSVVWGMPGAAAQAGVCSAVLPLGEIAPTVLRVVAGGSL